VVVEQMEKGVSYKHFVDKSSGTIVLKSIHSNKRIWKNNNVVQVVTNGASDFVVAKRMLKVVSL